MSQNPKQAELSIAFISELRVSGKPVPISLEVRDGSQGTAFRGEATKLPTISIRGVVNDLKSDRNLVGLGSIVLPEAIQDLELTINRFGFYLRKSKIQYTCHSIFTVDDSTKKIGFAVAILLEKTENTWSYSFGGDLTLGTSEFNLAFGKSGEISYFLANYTGQESQKIRPLIQSISTDLAQYIPDAWEITLKQALFVYCKEPIQDGIENSSVEGTPNQPNSTNTGSQPKSKSKSKFIFGIDIATNISLSDLPLVGSRIPPEYSISIPNLKIIATSNELSEAVLRTLITQEKNVSSLLGQNIRQLPKGLNLSPELKFGSNEEAFFLQLNNQRTEARTPPDGSPGSNAPSPESNSANSGTGGALAKPDNVKWFKIQKKIGPITFQQAGVKYEAGWLWLLLDMSLSIAQLTLTLDGLAAGFNTQKLLKLDPEGLIPKFDLRGIGISYKGGSDLEISGAFLRSVIDTGTQDTDGNPITRDEYSGAVLLKTKAFTLSAIGSYTELDGHPSLFIYAFLDKSLGGPAFFFVTGLAAGFGYNRKLIRPSLDNISEFPLVKMAMGGGSGPGAKTPQIKPKPDEQTAQLVEILSSLQAYVPPAPGENFLAIGVKFNSFKIIDSFALLIASFGKKFQLTLLGLSKIVSPPAETGVTPVAEVQIALKAEFIPDEGILKVDGKILPGSYILSRACTLSGGFAFYSWFSGEHEGDFVLTAGGYHPKFQIPEHYPRCDRLALNWKVDDSLSIKGQAYFALTSSAIMAGGRMEAIWQKDNLKVWFIAVADFLIAWKPYFYDISLSLTIGVLYTFDVSVRAFGQELFRIRKTLSTSLSADLHIWGPEFTGTARISWTVISIAVQFGSSKSTQPQPISWDKFKGSFLPAPTDVCSISVKDGLIKTIGEGGTERWVINPKDFSLITDTAIPIKQVTLSGTKKANERGELTQGKEKKFGISSMGINSGSLSSSYTITITKDGSTDQDDPTVDDFEYSPISKSVPSGLWGDTQEGKAGPANLNGKPIQNALCGFEIKPANQPAPGATKEIGCEALGYNSDDYGYFYRWEDWTLPATEEPDSTERLIIPEHFVEGDILSRLQQTLGSRSEDIKINSAIFEDLLATPLKIK